MFRMYQIRELCSILRVDQPEVYWPLETPSQQSERNGFISMIGFNDEQFDPFDPAAYNSVRAYSHFQAVPEQAAGACLWYQLRGSGLFRQNRTDFSTAIQSRALGTEPAQRLGEWCRIVG